MSNPVKPKNPKSAMARWQTWTDRHLGVDRTRFVLSIHRGVAAHVERQRQAFGVSRVLFAGAALLHFERASTKEQQRALADYRDLHGEPINRKTPKEVS